MQWVLLVVIVAALLFLSRYFPKVAFSVLGTLIAAVLVIIFMTTDRGQTKRFKLPIENIKIENIVVEPAYGNSYRFNARMINTDESIELKESSISITMLDCPIESDDSNSDCQIVGQKEERINVKIPPGQARDISRTLSFGTTTPTGTLRWQLVVTQTRS